jgi:hypothetical protein
MTFVPIPLESRLLLLAASLFIPRTQRTDWRMEWDGEVWWWITSQPEAGRSVRERLALARSTPAVALSRTLTPGFGHAVLPHAQSIRGYEPHPIWTGAKEDPGWRALRPIAWATTR